MHFIFVAGESLSSMKWANFYCKKLKPDAILVRILVLWLCLVIFLCLTHVVFL